MHFPFSTCTRRCYTAMIRLLVRYTPAAVWDVGRLPPRTVPFYQDLVRFSCSAHAVSAQFTGSAFSRATAPHLLPAWLFPVHRRHCNRTVPLHCCRSRRRYRRTARRRWRCAAPPFCAPALPGFIAACTRTYVRLHAVAASYPRFCMPAQLILSTCARLLLPVPYTILFYLPLGLFFAPPHCRSTDTTPYMHHTHYYRFTTGYIHGFLRSAHHHRYYAALVEFLHFCIFIALPFCRLRFEHFAGTCTAFCIFGMNTKACALRDTLRCDVCIFARHFWLRFCVGQHKRYISFASLNCSLLAFSPYGSIRYTTFYTKQTHLLYMYCYQSCYSSSLLCKSINSDQSVDIPIYICVIVPVRLWIMDRFQDFRTFSFSGFCPGECLMSILMLLAACACCCLAAFAL